ncbi:NEDD4-binding protein 1-like [Episyrphus balteatus]|uniref:NEDD4-binding protein 1-like n=1 Tax=Episyrphus balteatus TaxID=286459 RepID=UPI0024856607|nr:NEDD4-binding protein 1-like [Episyrphus balteatus]
MAQDSSINERNTEEEPSTSRAVLTNSPLKKRSPFKKKSFVKLKDNKYRDELIEKYKLNSKKRFPIGLNGLSSPSLSQATSKKIIHQIKKRNNKSYNKSPAKSNMLDETPRQRSSNEGRTTKIEVIDDDCICIETKPEVITIEDETIAPMNVVKELEMKYLKFKQYEAIGSIRMNHQLEDNKNNQVLTSTPNPNRSNGVMLTRGPFNQDADSSFGALSSSTICYNSDDITIVEDVRPTTTNDDVIVIDDTIVPSKKSLRREAAKRNRSKNNDDSVIFVSENFSPSRKRTAPAPAFIPLNTPAEEVKIKLPPIPDSPPRPKRKCTQRNNDLFTSREEKQLKQYNENAYNPNKDADKEKTEKKRMVIIDGSNVAYQHALNKEFSVKGLKICLDYFTKMGYEVKAVVPQYRLQKQKSSNPGELETLHREGKIVFTPCKNLPGKSSTSYDDRFILQLASELDAAVVSNDNYRDLLNENAALKKIIENRVIGYTWCNDVFILPKDPYGKWGPTLDTILNRS